MSRLIVVSNRVSVAKGRGAAGAQGGLAVAMSAALHKRGGIWFGWSGNEVEHFTGQLTMERVDGFTTGQRVVAMTGGAGHRGILQRLCQPHAVAALSLSHRSRRI